MTLPTSSGGIRPLAGTGKGAFFYHAHQGRQDWQLEGPRFLGSMVNQAALDPRDGVHLYIALSSGGVFESLDRGASWRALNRGVAASFLPDPEAQFGHDPHCLAIHPLHPDRLYHQNHCGLYRLDRPGAWWQRVGDNLPREVGDIGFPGVVHPRDPDSLWMLPMDGTDTGPRTCPEGRPALHRSCDGGASWERRDRGLLHRAWWTVKRQALATDGHGSVGLYFGTTSGELWMSDDEGACWRQIAAHLPEILAVDVVSRP